MNENQQEDKNNAPVTILITGPTGGGKSTAAAILIRQVDFPVIFIDPADSVAEKLGDDAKDRLYGRNNSRDLFFAELGLDKLKGTVSDTVIALP